MAVYKTERANSRTTSTNISCVNDSISYSALEQAD